MIRRLIDDVVRAFLRHGCFDLAANLSFYALLSLIPLAMIMASLAGFFLGSSEAIVTEMGRGIMDVVPMIRQEFLANVRSLLHQRSALGLTGIVSLFFIATLLMSSIERALDVVFQSEVRRNFFHSRLLGIVLIFTISLVFFLPTMAQILDGLLHRYGFNFPLLGLLRAKASFVVIALLAYAVTVVVIPNHRIQLRYALLGGTIFAAGITVAKILFRSYTKVALTRYNVIYGSLTAVVLLVLWIYYLAVVMLIASEVVAVFQARRFCNRRRVDPPFTSC